MSRKTFVAYRFSRFDDYWIKTNKQTPAHPDKQRALLYRLQAKSFLKGISYFPITQCFGFNFLYGLDQGLYLIRNRIQITIFTCNSHIFFDDVCGLQLLDGLMAAAPGSLACPISGAWPHSLSKPQR